MNGNTLIFSQCLIRNAAEQRLADISINLMRRLNPDADFLLIDNASPITPCVPLAVEIFRFPDQIGHFSPKFAHETAERRDGPGRAMMTALRMAMDRGYQRACYIESDCLLAKPVDWGFEHMTAKTAALPRSKWGYIDTNAFWVADLPWLRDFEFIEEYDWPNQTGVPEGERIYEDILGPNVETLPLKGRRADGFTMPDGTWIEGFITPENIRELFPGGIDYITHCSTATFAEFLKMNGHDDLARAL